MVTGKTGARRVRIVALAPLLATWLENHPDNKNPDAPLWTGIGARGRNEPLSYYAARIVLMRLMKRTGIQKKFNPHIFRHSPASMLANVLTKAQMKEYFGWLQDSDMAATYEHLSGRNGDNALLKIHGIDLESKENSSKFQVRICPRCKQSNSPGQFYCGKCRMPLSLKAVVTAEEQRSSREDVLTTLFGDSQVQALIGRKIKELGLTGKIASS